MSLSRLCVGFSSANKGAREGGNLEVVVRGRDGPCAFRLPWFVVRQIDELLEKWRREAHEAVLITMHSGLLGRTLGQAARAGGLRDVSFLLSRGAEVNFRHAGKTPLELCAPGGHTSVATALLEAGASFGTGSSALAAAAASGRAPLVALLLRSGADVAQKQSALVCAAGGGHVQTVELLLKDVAVVRLNAALCAAAFGGHGAVVTLLLENGADLNFESFSQECPLAEAARGGHLETVELLLQAGAIGLGRALYFATQSSQVAMAARLLEAGASPAWLARSLNQAAPTGSLDMIRFLTEKCGAYIDIPDQNPQPLGLAVRGGHVEATRLLLDLGADVNANVGDAIRQARRGMCEPMVALLLERGACKGPQGPFPSQHLQPLSDAVNALTPDRRAGVCALVEGSPAVTAGGGGPVLHLGRMHAWRLWELFDYCFPDTEEQTAMGVKELYVAAPLSPRSERAAKRRRGAA